MTVPFAELKNRLETLPIEKADRRAFELLLDCVGELSRGQLVRACAERRAAGYVAAVDEARQTVRRAADIMSGRAE